MSQIGIIIPVYNVERYLSRCLDSVLAQTFRDFELILIDDGSTDNCGAICDGYAAKDARVHVIHQENRGLSAARNAGINWVFANSDCPWITFVDSDDWIHSEYLKAMYSAAQEHRVKLVQCNSIDVSVEEEAPDGIQQTVSRQAAPEEAFMMCGASVAMRKLIDRSLIGQYRFPVGKVHEDEYLTYRWFFATDKVAIVDNAYYYYSIRPDSITHSQWSYKRLDAMEAYQNQLSFFRDKANDEMYCLTLSRYMYWLTEQYFKCRDSNYPDKCSVMSMLRHEMRKRFGEYYRVSGGFEHMKNLQVFEVAFPKIAWVYWTVKAQLVNITRKGTTHSG